MLLVRDEKVLLLLRANTGYEDGSYCVISWHVESDETVAMAALREAREEVGVEIKPADLHGVHVMHVRADGVRRERIAFFFRCEQWRGETENREPDKCGGLIWAPIRELPLNTIPYIREAIRYPADHVFSEFGW